MCWALMWQFVCLGDAFQSSTDNLGLRFPDLWAESVWSISIRESPREAAIELNLSWCVLTVTQTSDAQLLAHTAHGYEQPFLWSLVQKYKLSNRKHWQNLYLKPLFPSLSNWRKHWNNVMFAFSVFDYSLNCLDFTVKTKTVAAQLPGRKLAVGGGILCRNVSVCPLGRILSFILLQSPYLLYSCCQGYCGGLLAQQGVLSGPSSYGQFPLSILGGLWSGKVRGDEDG